jgi:nucleotide-binding universal stress UspA family protein
MTIDGVRSAPVVVAVDRTGSPAAVEYAALEAVRSGRRLDLVHVAPATGGWHAQVGQDALRAAVARAESLITAPDAVHGRVVHGSVVPELAHHSVDAALLVMGRVPPRQQRVPSTKTTSALANVVDAAVVVVPSDWIDPRRNVVSLGLEPGFVDEHAARTALMLSRLRGAVLRVVVSGNPPTGPVFALLRAMGGDGCDIAVELTREAPIPALARAAATSDLVILGRRRPGRGEGARLGPVSRAVLEDLSCPLLLATPGHVHIAGGPTPGPLTTQEVSSMYARPGDRIVIRSGLLGAPVRDGEVLEVSHEDGTPPYRVRWSDDGHVSLFFPGPDAYIDHSSLAVS